jgi:hypothetical protein
MHCLGTPRQRAEINETVGESKWPATNALFWHFAVAWRNQLNNEREQIACAAGNLLPLII